MAVAATCLLTGCGSPQSEVRASGDASATVADGSSQEGAASDAVADVRSDQPTDATSDATATGACALPLVWSRSAGSPTGHAISGSAPADLWVITGVDQFDPLGGQVWRGDGTSWTPAETRYQSWTLWVVGPDDLLVGGGAGVDGAHGVRHWDGAQWTPFDLGDNREVETLWGSGKSDIWGARGDGQYLGRWDGVTWMHIDSANGGVLAGGGPGDFWSAAPRSTTTPGAFVLSHHSASGAWDQAADLANLDCPGCGALPCTDCNLYAGWASDTDDVWFVGAGGRTHHFDGNTWSVIPAPAGGAALRSIWGSSKTDVWAVGDGGVTLHFDGMSWTSAPSPTTADLAGVWSSGPCDVWVIGDAAYHAQP